MDVVRHWYLVHTKPQKERVAKENLERQGYPFYLPLARQTRRRKGRWLDVIEPLFPRYLFVRLGAGHDSFRSVRYTTGVQNLVCFSEKPAVVPDSVVNSLMRAADPDTGLHDLNAPVFEPGKAVVIDSGPLAGVQGILLAKTGEDRVIVLLNMLGKENRVAIEHDLVRLV